MTFIATTQEYDEGTEKMICTDIIENYLIDIPTHIYYNN